MKEEKKQRKKLRRPTKQQMHQTSRAIWRNRELYVMLLPAIVCIFIFKYIPMPGVLMAFQDYSYKKGIFGSPFVGFKHFETFLYSSEFWVTAKNTLVISLIKLVFCFPVPIIFALLLNELKSAKFKKAVQLFVYLPHFVSWVIMVSIMRTIFTPYGGIFNTIRNSLGLESIFVMGLKSTFYPLLVGSDIWKNVGWSSIIYIAALNGIDQELYEAATVDGANRLRKAWHITLPGIVPTIVLLFIMQMGSLLAVDFEQILLLQQPGNLSVSNVITTYILRVGLQEGNFELGSALGLVMAAFGFVCVWITNKISKKVSDISLW